MNLNNFYVGCGRLTEEPKTFTNSDGSVKVKFTLAEQNNYKSADGTRGAEFIPFETLIPANRVKAGANGAPADLGVYSMIHKGDKITVHASARNNNYTKADGTQVYGIVLYVEELKLDEPKATTDARRAQNAAAAAQATPETAAQ